MPWKIAPSLDAAGAPAGCHKSKRYKEPRYDYPLPGALEQLDRLFGKLDQLFSKVPFAQVKLRLSLFVFHG
ncbi:MAG: hypothetical protein HGA45_23780 [Chloroflexales bacterium]|nr:hypothetical protein [Chloroflexales bacterium]